MEKTIFTEDTFHTTLTHLSIATRRVLSYPCGRAEKKNKDSFSITTKEANDLYRAIEDFQDVAFLSEMHFSNQFYHTPKVRRVCPNPDCHTVYAYFYEDFLYCPKCGTKLIETRYDLDGTEVRPTRGTWIQTSKALPQKRDWYLGVFKEPDGWINPLPFICDYLLGSITPFTTKEGWIIHNCTDVDNPIDYYVNLKCVAWMPLPEPYVEYEVDCE